MEFFSSIGISAAVKIAIGVIQRPLAFPDELMVLRRNQELLLIETHNPIDVERIAYYQDDRLKPLADQLPRRQKTFATPATTIPAGAMPMPGHVQTAAGAGYPPVAS